MSRRNIYTLLSAAILLISMLSGCGGPSTPPPASVSVSPVTDSIIAAGAQQFTAKEQPGQFAGSVVPLGLQQSSNKTGMVVQKYTNLPLAFGANVGQTSPEVRFISRGRSYTTFLTSNEAVLELAGPRELDRPGLPPLGPGKKRAPGHSPTSVLRMRLTGANPNPNITGLRKLSGKSNYIVGNDPKKWRTDVPGYAELRYEGVYPGIDLLYHGNQRQLEYDFVIAPHANPSAIEFEVEPDTLGATARPSTRIACNGDLVIALNGGDVVFHAPVIYQQKPNTGNADSSAQRDFVSGRYILAAGNRVKFRVGSYDRNRPLIIDPTLSYATYLGSSDIDVVNGMVVDSSGYVYVVGQTASVNFPVTPEAYDTTCESCSYRLYDAFVAKLTPDGSAIVYATYIGGDSNEDKAYAVTVDASGSVYVVGTTDSPDFPTTANAFQHGADGDWSWNTFISKLSPNGDSLTFSTLLGGNQQDFPGGVAVDASGAVYVTGNTTSTNFPTKNALQPTYGGGYACGSGGFVGGVRSNHAAPNVGGGGDPCPDAYITKLKADGSDLVYSTYLGTTFDESGSAIAVDASGNAFVAGTTNSGDLPMHNALQLHLAGGYDGFILKLNPSGSSILFSTFLGGSSDENIQHMVLDSSGNIYVTGATNSTDFPLKNAAQSANAGSPDAFVAKINAAGTALLYSTYLGGSAGDRGMGIALDSSRNIYVLGQTASTDFPTVNPVQADFSGVTRLSNFFVTEIPAAGGTPTFSTYLGGSGGDYAAAGAIGVDNVGNIYIAGSTYSTDFPIVNAMQPAFAGIVDGTVAKISPLTAPGVSLVPTSLDFGDQPEGVTSAPRTSVLTNTGTQSLTISSIALVSGTDYQQTNDCPISPSVLAGGGHCTISVTFKPTVVGTRQDQAVINSDVSESPHSISLTGYGEPPAPAVTFSVSSLTFADQLVGTRSGTQTVTLTNAGSAALGISSIASQGTDFAQTNDCPIWPSTLAVSAHCTFTITFAPGTRGNLSGSITVSDNSSDSPQSVALAGRGIVPAAVQLSTTTLDFGGQLLGSASSPRSLTLTNSGDQGLTISSIVAGGDFSVTQPCSPTTLAGNASCNITMKFTPTAIGVRDSTLTITHDAAGSPATVTLKGTGQDLAFGTQSGGATSASVNAGATATYNLQITPTGYSGTANLSCRFQGTQPRGTACSVLPASVTLNGVDAATFIVSVTTTARSTAASLALPSPLRVRPTGYLAIVFSLTLFMIIATSLRLSGQNYAKSRNRTVWAPAEVALFLALLCGLPGCGGGSTPPPQTGTPAGTYNITLSATAGGVTKTSTLTLAVN